jgi:hypothetical protein
VVRAAAEGCSGIAVLVGGSSTGKTRACWEALQVLRDRPGLWRLWHPIDPSRPDATLRELPGIGPRTVVWLNEAQFYLEVADGGLGERVAAGLRELLRDPARAPVLVLATVWPQFWDTLTGRPAGVADFAVGAEGKPLRPGSILARVGLVWQAQVGAQHIDAGLPVLGPVVRQARHGIHPGQPDRRRLITAELPGRCGEPLVQRPGALLLERPGQLLTGGVATRNLHRYRSGQGEKADAGCDDRRDDLRAHN